jgi:hypothetical protein
MSFDKYKLLKVSVNENGVASVSIANPPMNIVTFDMYMEW